MADKDDIGAALGAAWDKLAAGETDAPQANDAPREEPQAREGVSTDEAPAGEERPRDEQGRFTKQEAPKPDGKDKARPTLTLKGKKDAAEEPQRPAQEPAQQAANPQAAEAAKAAAEPANQQTAPILPPQHWRGDSKVEWARLPYHVKEAITKDYGEVGQLRELQPALQQFTPLLMQRYGNVGNGLGSVLSLWQAYLNNPLDTIRGLMQQSGIHPQHLVAGASGQPQSQADQSGSQQYVTQRDVEAMYERAQAEAQQRLFAQQINSEIQNFGTAVNSDGTLKYPYFNDVRELMSALFTADSTGKLTLDGAYNQAVYANPTVRQRLMAAEQDKQAAERRKTAEQARNAAATVTGAPGPRGPSKASNETVEQSLNRAWERSVSGARA